MTNVCVSCHGQAFADGHFHQFDATVRLYNEKFAKPATELMNLVRSRDLLEKKASFSNDIERIYWEIWHHEGRRARHGVSMMAPDYTHWHGLYEVAKHWYSKFIPELREIAAHHLESDDPAKVAGAKALDAAVDELLARPEHAWYLGQLPADELERRKQAQEEFRSRYE